MSHYELLACAAVVASIVLAMQHRPLLFPVIALVASGLEALTAFGIVHVSLKHVSLGLVLGVALAISALVVYFKAAQKSVITASTVAALIGLLQVLSAFHLR